MATAAYLSADATVSAHRASAVTTSNSTIYEQPTRGLYIGAAGNLTVDMADGGSSVLFVGVPGGTVLPIQVTRIYATGTTATSIVALY
jgi:hypothetical protein